MNRTILEHAKSMRIHSKLPKGFLVDAINTAIYLINREPSVALDTGVLEET